MVFQSGRDRLLDKQANIVSDKYTPHSAIASHFEPPLLPSALWQKSKIAPDFSHRER